MNDGVKPCAGRDMLINYVMRLNMTLRTLGNFTSTLTLLRQTKILCARH